MSALDKKGQIIANELVDDALAVMTIAVEEIPHMVRPGQFVHLRFPGAESHLLRRPFGVLDADEGSSTLRILYQAIGQVTSYMRTLQPGTPVDVMGPLGNHWVLPEGTKRVLVVAGGAGAAPLVMFARELQMTGVEVKVALGARTESALACKPHFEEAVGEHLLCATDDGSCGHPGLVTEVVENLLQQTNFDFIACCGPDPMMRAVAALAKEHELPLNVSLEARMACGIGACLSCVVDTVDGKKRVCADGPIFDASEVIW